MRHTLMGARMSWLPELPELAVLLEPIPGVQDSMRLLDSLMCLAEPLGNTGEFSKFSDIRALDGRLGILGFAVVVQEEARRRAALTPPLAFGAADRVEYGLGEYRAGLTAVGTAPRLVSGLVTGFLS